MDAKNPQYRQIIEAGFRGAAFVNDIGITLLDFGPGWCESSMTILPRHLQHGGVVHAGIQQRSPIIRQAVRQPRCWNRVNML